MLCSNCGKNEATIRYTHIVNGKKKEMALCEECAKKEGIDDLDFSMPIDFSSFLGDFFEDDNIISNFALPQTQKCKKCGLTYDEFIKTGRFGCNKCYDAFSNKLDNILKNLHGSSRHIGRKPQNIEIEESKVENNESSNEDRKNNVIDEKQQKINQLNSDLQLAIKEERYEDAAKIRDEIKKIK
jgi:protein arginine kinase activator